MKQINIFKHVALLAAVVITFCNAAQAQLNGTYTIAGTSPDYSTLSAAISALNSNGVSGPVTFLIRDGSYSGTSWMGVINNISGASSTNTITFRSQSGNKANVTISGNSSSNYIFRLNNAKYITVKDLTLEKTSSSYCRVFDFTSQASFNVVENCALKAPATTTSSNAAALVYAYSHTGTDNKVSGCSFTNGGSFIYVYGVNTSSNTSNWTISNNTFTATNSGYYGIYSYYSSGVKILNNTLTRTGSGVYYTTYNYYCNNDFEMSNNTLTASGTSTMYGLSAYYCNYYSNSTTNTPRIMNNTVTLTGTSGTIYPFYTYYCVRALINNNQVSTSATSATLYLYGPLYYANASRAEGNTITINKTSTGYIYNYSTANSSNYPDTFTNNTLTFNSPYYIYNYMVYYGNTIVTDNTYNISNTSYYNYNYIYYANGALFANNKINSNVTTGVNYGIYEQGTTSYAGVKCYNNVVNATSTSGTTYGIFTTASNTSQYYGNVVSTKTTGTNYTLYVSSNYNSKFKNNTFHSNATGSTNYIAYIYNTSSSYKTELKNNIFSKSASTGYGVYAYNKSYFTADYNLYYVPGGTLFYSNSPSYTGGSLQNWRNTTGQDKNSLVYQPPYVNAGANDFRINASSPAAWAVNGRAEHDTMIKTDVTGANRPYLVPSGVPDLGAYEVSPTSTPPNADASPANPVANSTQVFTFGQDTVATIDWGADVPSTYTVRQYTGVQAAPMPVGVGRMYFYVAGTPSTWVHGHKPNIYYKDPWSGDIPGGENEAVPARSSNSGAWEGYNYTNAQIDKARNIVKPTNTLDSVGSYTAVQNGRIGIRCVENPKGIAITNITAFDADIDWQPVFNPIGYQVLIKKNSKYPTNTEWSSSNLTPTNNLAAGGLDEDTKYYVFIRSICGAKDTSGFTMDSFTTLITCHTPVITISGVNGNRAVISWQAVKTATKYEYALNKSSTPPAVGTDLNKNSMLAPFLDEGVEYYVHVRAHCSSMYDKSDWASAKFNTWALGIGNVNGEGSGLSVFPNPVQQDMVVTISGQVAEGTVTITDMTGKVLKTQTVNSNKTTINVSELPAGMYIVQYADDSRREQVKFSKQ